jgi:hypothetical protein
MATERSFRMLAVGIAEAAAGFGLEVGEVLTAVVERNEQRPQRPSLETAGFPGSHTDYIGLPIDDAVSCCVVQLAAVGSVGDVQRGGEWAS